MWTASSSTPTAAQTPGEQRWAVVIGVDIYERKDLIPSLGCAVSDAEGFARTLRELAGFEEDKVFLLTSDSQDENRRATKPNVAYWLGWVSENADQDDLVVFYFAGHGVTRKGKGFLLTQDTDPRSLLTLEASSVEVAWVQGVLSGMQAPKVLAFIDACRSEPVKEASDREGESQGLTGDFARGFAIRPKPAVSDAIAATFFACSVGQRSYEWRANQHGFFTYYLLEGLRGKAADQDGRITPGSLGRYLTEKVPEAVKREVNADQVPWPSKEGPGEYRVQMVAPRDLEAPHIEILEPTGVHEGERVQVETDRPRIVGQATDNTAVQEVKVNGLDAPPTILEPGSLPPGRQGVRFAIEVPLGTVEQQQIEVVARDQAGNTAQLRFQLARPREDRAMPRLQILEPPGAEDGAHLRIDAERVRLRGIASDDMQIREVRVNQRMVSTQRVRPDDPSLPVTLAPGWRGVVFEKPDLLVGEQQETEVEVAVWDAADNSIVARFYLLRPTEDRQAPRLRILQPAGVEEGTRIEVEEAETSIAGLAGDDLGIAEVQLAGQPLSTRPPTGAEATMLAPGLQVVGFEGKVALAEGEEKQVVVEARDASGNRAGLRFQLIRPLRDRSEPRIQILEPTGVRDGVRLEVRQERIQVAGVAGDDMGINQLRIGDQVVPLLPEVVPSLPPDWESGRFASEVVLAEGEEREIVVEAQDTGGKTARVRFRLARQRSDRERPRLQILEPAGVRDGARLEVRQDQVRIVGVVGDDLRLAEVRLNDRVPRLRLETVADFPAGWETGRFEGRVEVAEGQQAEVVVAAADAAGNQVEVRFQLVHPMSDQAPRLLLLEPPGVQEGDRVEVAAGQVRIAGIAGDDRGIAGVRLNEQELPTDAQTLAQFPPNWQGVRFKGTVSIKPGEEQAMVVEVGDTGGHASRLSFWLVAPKLPRFTVSLAHRVQAGDVAAYRSVSSFRLNGNRYQLNMLYRDRIVEVKDNAITRERTYHELALLVNGKRAGHPPDVFQRAKEVIVYRTNGIPISARLEGVEAGQWQGNLDWPPVLPAQAIGLGDRWRYTFPADYLLGWTAGTAEYEVVGFEAFKQWETARIALSYYQGVSQGDPMVTGILWVELRSGTIVRADYRLHHVPVQDKVVEGTFLVERTDVR